MEGNDLLEKMKAARINPPPVKPKKEANLKKLFKIPKEKKSSKQLYGSEKPA